MNLCCPVCYCLTPRRISPTGQSTFHCRYCGSQVIARTTRAKKILDDRAYKGAVLNTWIVCTDCRIAFPAEPGEFTSILDFLREGSVWCPNCKKRLFAWLKTLPAEENYVK